MLKGSTAKQHNIMPNMLASCMDNFTRNGMRHDEKMFSPAIPVNPRAYRLQGIIFFRWLSSALPPFL